MSTDPMSELTVIWNAGAKLLETETDPHRRLMLYEIMDATERLKQDLRAQNQPPAI